MSNTEYSNNPKVTWVEVNEDQEGQRLDNFLISLLKGVPKSRIYRIVRKGEVRINKGRCAVSQRLKNGDVVRIPPIRVAQKESYVFVPDDLRSHLQQGILYEDECLIALNKPSGFAVHGGSGVNSGIIEGLREIRPEATFLELVHRLDRETSGCLLIAKKRSALRKLHEIFRNDSVRKTYLALLAGQWQRSSEVVRQPLRKNVQKSGERMVVIDAQGKFAETRFRKLKSFQHCTLVQAAPKTGRTHQIRVHASYLGHAIIGDTRYGWQQINLKFRQKGYTRLFLHAEKLLLQHPLEDKVLSITAPLPEDLQSLLHKES